MRNLLLAACLASLALSPADAQRRRKAERPRAFSGGSTVLGAVVGVGGLDYGASSAFGARLERGIKTLPDGALGVGLAVDYYKFDYGFGSMWAMPLAATVNYHIRIDEETLDPYVGLGLGKIRYGDSDEQVDTGLYTVVRGGFRWRFTGNWALDVDAGMGAATFGIGIARRF